MHGAPRPQVSPADPRLRVPDAATWAQLTEEEKVRIEDRIYAALNADVLAMSESTLHFRPKVNAYKDLEDHFSRTGRQVFLACELAVLYPGEDAFAPDMLAVVDVEDPQRDRDSWRVVDEGRGIDLALELRNKGSQHKDLVDNVRDYARLGIPEYFVFDCRSKLLRGFRLVQGSSAYLPIRSERGYLTSMVLGLDLAVLDGRLRFFSDQMMVPSSSELLIRVQQLVDEQQRHVEETEQKLGEAEQKRGEALARLQQVHAEIAGRVLARLAGRGLQVRDAERQRVLLCQDLQRLLTWLERAAGAQTLEEALE